MRLLSLTTLFALVFQGARTLEVGTNCLAITCESMEGKCCDRSDLELKVTLSDNCRRLEYCDVNSDWEGVCKARNYYIDPVKLYPGDPCVQGDFKTTCAFGLQRCGNSGYCLSVGHDGECSQSADCPPYQYCEMGTCTNFKKIGSKCFHRNECGRQATCFFNNPRSISGVCTEYMKIDSKSPVNVKMQIDSYSVINEDSHLLCRSQYSDPTGNCSDGAISQKKGQPCDTTADCPSVDGTTTARCQCGWNSKKTRYCDLLPGDDEWLEVRSLFVEYFTATRDDCNTDARWEPCNVKSLYNKWMCAKLRAENYPLLIDEGTLSCMDNLYAYLPIFSDIYEYCYSFASSFKAAGIALGVSIGLLMTL